MKRITLILLSIFAFSSCFEESETVDVILNEDLFVVNGFVGDQKSLLTINKAVLNINDEITFVEGADVLLVSNSKEIQLEETNTGIYAANEGFDLGVKCDLRIIIDNSQIKGKAQIPAYQPSFSSISIFSNPMLNVSNINFELSQGVSNTMYLEIVFLNDATETSKNRLIQIEQGTDFFAFIEKNAFEKGENISLEIRTLNKETFQYLSRIRALEENSVKQISSNLHGPALGFFKSFLSEEFEITVE